MIRSIKTRNTKLIHYCKVGCCSDDINDTGGDESLIDNLELDDN